MSKGNTMKAAEGNMPMISVPAGVLKEFMGTKSVNGLMSNSRKEDEDDPDDPDPMDSPQAPPTEAEEEEETSNSAKRENEDTDEETASKKPKLDEENNKKEEEADVEADLSGLLEEVNNQLNEVEETMELLKEDLSPLSVSQDKAEILAEEVDQIKKAAKKKLHRLTRKELEEIILKEFSERILYQHELGRMKQLCDKLEATLETNRKKTAQFHKEIEDMRKVTSRLAMEHQARKGQCIAPIKIKRSVGIQAAPHIINKGIMFATGGQQGRTATGRTQGITTSMTNTASGSQVSMQKTSHALPTTSPLRGVIPNPSTPNVTFNSKTLTASTSAVPGNIVPSSHSYAASQVVPNVAGKGAPQQGQMLMVAPKTVVHTVARPASGLMVRTPGGQPAQTFSTQSSGILSTGQRPMLIQASPSATQHTDASGQFKKGSAVIDLTDEDDANKGKAGSIVPSSGALVKLPNNATGQLTSGQFLTIPQPGRVLLLPSTAGGTQAAIVVSNASNVPGVGTIVSQARVGLSSVTSGATSTVRTAAPMALPTVPTKSSTLPPSSRHPAPLPPTPVQRVAGTTKELPPQPTLKLTLKDNSIVLSWTMTKTSIDHEGIASYQLYAYQEGTAPPSPSLWKKVGSVKALELPMACTLTQFMPGHRYHFAVRGVDNKSRLGPFSEPRSIKLDKSN